MAGAKKEQFDTLRGRRTCKKSHCKLYLLYLLTVKSMIIIFFFLQKSIARMLRASRYSYHRFHAITQVAFKTDCRSSESRKNHANSLLKQLCITSFLELVQVEPVCLPMAKHLYTGQLALFYGGAGVNPDRIVLLVQVIMPRELRPQSVSNPSHICKIKSLLCSSILINTMALQSSPSYEEDFFV